LAALLAAGVLFVLKPPSANDAAQTPGTASTPPAPKEANPTPDPSLAKEMRDRETINAARRIGRIHYFQHNFRPTQAATTPESGPPDWSAPVTGEVPPELPVFDFESWYPRFTRSYPGLFESGYGVMGSDLGIAPPTSSPAPSRPPRELQRPLQDVVPTNVRAHFDNIEEVIINVNELDAFEQGSLVDEPDFRSALCSIYIRRSTSGATMPAGYAFMCGRGRCMFRETLMDPLGLVFLSYEELLAHAVFSFWKNTCRPIPQRIHATTHCSYEQTGKHLSFARKVYEGGPNPFDLMTKFVHVSCNGYYCAKKPEEALPTPQASTSADADKADTFDDDDEESSDDESDDETIVVKITDGEKWATTRSMSLRMGNGGPNLVAIENGVFVAYNNVGDGHVSVRHIHFAAMLKEIARSHTTTLEHDQDAWEVKVSIDNNLEEDHPLYYFAEAMHGRSFTFQF
jgi:hypothetical protein